MGIKVPGTCVSVVVALSFVTGALFGYWLKGKRVGYLKKKKDVLINKLNETQEKINYALS